LPFGWGWLCVATSALRSARVRHTPSLPTRQACTLVELPKRFHPPLRFRVILVARWHINRPPRPTPTSPCSPARPAPVPRGCSPRGRLSRTPPRRRPACVARRGGEVTTGRRGRARAEGGLQGWQGRGGHRGRGGANAARISRGGALTAAIRMFSSRYALRAERSRSESALHPSSFRRVQGMMRAPHSTRGVGVAYPAADR
jgi:hypothetical protein